MTLIQGVISRMASNSFLLKGWVVTILAAILALGTANHSAWFVAIGFLPTTMFWCLDSYYLRQERLYRALYDSVRVVVETEQTKCDFSMNTEEEIGLVAPWKRILVSRTEFWFYFPVELVVLAAVIITKLGEGPKHG